MLNVNLKVVTTAQQLLHSQPFLNSHSHFLIIMESVTPPGVAPTAKTNVSLMGKDHDYTVNAP